jgi:hypothetical protein
MSWREQNGELWPRWDDEEKPIEDQPTQPLERRLVPVPAPAWFTLRGRSGSRVGVTITWRDGQLSGDPEGVAMVLRLAEAHEGVPFSFPGGIRSRRRHLAHPLAARALACMVYTGVVHQIAGTLPPLGSSGPGEEDDEGEQTEQGEEESAS